MKRIFLLLSTTMLLVATSAWSSDVRVGADIHFRLGDPAHDGSAALDNEECYMLQKLLRSWGLVYIEHQARI